MSERYLKYAFENFSRMHEMVGKIRGHIEHHGYQLGPEIFDTELNAWKTSIYNDAGSEIGAFAAKNIGKGGELFVVSQEDAGLLKILRKYALEYGGKPEISQRGSKGLL